MYRIPTRERDKGRKKNHNTPYRPAPELYHGFWAVLFLSMAYILWQPTDKRSSDHSQQSTVSTDNGERNPVTKNKPMQNKVLTVRVVVFLVAGALMLGIFD